MVLPLQERGKFDGVYLNALVPSWVACLPGDVTGACSGICVAYGMSYWTVPQKQTSLFRNELFSDLYFAMLVGRLAWLENPCWGLRIDLEACFFVF